MASDSVDDDLDLQEIELEQEKLALQRQELQLRERKLSVLRKRKGGENEATKEAGKGSKSKGGLHELGPSDNWDFLLQPDEKPTAEAVKLRKKAAAQFKPEEYTPWRLMIFIIALPLLLLVGTVLTMNWLYSEKFAQTPCQGICSINETVLAGYTSGCAEMTDNPGRLFLYMIPACHMGVLEPFVRSIMHVKSYQLVQVRNWRDALYAEPVYMSGPSKKGMSKDQYAHIYRTHINALVASRAPHNRLFMGSTYMWDMAPPNETDKKAPLVPANGTIRHVTFLRHPLLRLRAQYYLDRQRDVRYNTMSAYRRLPFEECAAIPACRHHYEFARWGNIQTKYLCGWSDKCLYDKRLNATHDMLAQALENLEDKFLAVGLVEEWDASIALMEKLLPTYFDGFFANISRGTCSASSAGDEWCAKPRDDEHTTTALALPSQDLALTNIPQLDDLLQHFVWADMILYQKAQELFYDKALLCRIKTIKPQDV